MGRWWMLAIAVPALAACSLGRDIIGSGTAATETREAADFSAVRLDGVGEVTVSIADATSVVVEADDNLIGRVTTTVESGTLVIDIDEGIDVVPRSGIRITVTTPSLTAVGVGGAGSVDVAAVTTDAFSIDMSGVGAIEVDDLVTGELTVDLGGAGEIDVSGEADVAVVRLSGVGSFDGGDLRATNVEVVASGAGSVEVWATGTLDVEATGVGSVSYWGAPDTRISASGIGEVEALGDR